MAKKADGLGLAESRRQLLSSLFGSVIEIGARAGSGFEIESFERYNFRIPPFDPPKPHIIGSARRPAEPPAATEDR